MKILELEGNMILDTQDPWEADAIYIRGDLIQRQFVRRQVYLQDVIRNLFTLPTGHGRGKEKLGNCRIRIEWDEVSD